jgi:hypothetical protein
VKLAPQVAFIAVSRRPNQCTLFKIKRTIARFRSTKLTFAISNTRSSCLIERINASRR